MIITSTPTIEGRQITAYHGMVFGEVIAGVNIVKDTFAQFRDVFGGRSKSYEDELIRARKEALREMEMNASNIGADAVVGVKVDYETIGGSMLMVIASGTAVTLR